MSRIAHLAAAKGGKTRAILKLAGRGAIALTVGTFNLATWLLWAIVTLLGFVSSLKRMTERITERYCVRRRLRLTRQEAASSPRLPLTLIPSHGTARQQRPRRAVRGRGFARREHAAFSARRRGDRVSR